jgi:biopolymer transport protein ExbD
MKSKRRLFQHSRAKPPESGLLPLQITSMADVFTILLVFLLKGVSTDALTITPSASLRLPVGIGSDAIRERALQVEVSPKGILVEKNFIAGLADFEKPLTRRLAAETANKGRVTLLTDGSIPYSTLKRVLGVLAKGGYAAIRFGVIRE